MSAESHGPVSEKLIYEYCLLRYVPDIERGEFINVGLMMMCKRRRWLRTALRIDEERALALAPECDLVRLRTQLGVFTRSDVPEAGLPVEERYRWMGAVKSAIIQTSPSHPGLLLLSDGDDVRKRLDVEFDRLFARLV